MHVGSFSLIVRILWGSVRRSCVRVHVGRIGGSGIRSLTLVKRFAVWRSSVRHDGSRIRRSGVRHGSSIRSISFVNRFSVRWSGVRHGRSRIRRSSVRHGSSIRSLSLVNGFGVRRSGVRRGGSRIRRSGVRIHLVVGWKGSSNGQASGEYGDQMHFYFSVGNWSGQNKQNAISWYFLIILNGYLDWSWIEMREDVGWVGQLIVECLNEQSGSDYIGGQQMEIEPPQYLIVCYDNNNTESITSTRKQLIVCYWQRSAENNYSCYSSRWLEQKQEYILLHYWRRRSCVRVHVDRIGGSGIRGSFTKFSSHSFSFKIRK